MNEDIDIDALLAELASRNTPVCNKAIYAIGALRGKKTVIPAVAEVAAEEPAPATVADAAAAIDP